MFPLCDLLREVLLCCIFLAMKTCMSGTTEPSYTELDTNAGKVRGLKQNILSKDIDVFLGIPFAEPPIGNKRFSRPVLKQGWTGVLNATKQPNSCFQMVDTTYGAFEGSQMWNPNTKMSEDCLYMNIWAPSDRSSPGLRPVMVWIFGGSYSSGSATLDIYDGRIMAAKGDVIVVTIQYRMGSMGFLYLDDEEIPGNMGLLDQSTAIKWIYTYIEAFGGDKNRITLFGESSGAAGISSHLMSEMSQPYIHNVILQSASTLAQWAVDPPEVAKSKALELAQLVNCNQDTKQDLIQCLKETDAEELVTKMWNVDDVSYISTPFVPTVDNYFFKDFPSNIIDKEKSKPVGVLLGFNKDEGTYFLIYEQYVDKSNKKHISRQNFLEAIGKMLNIKNQDLINLVAYEYSTHEEYIPNYSYTEALDDLLGDLAFVCSVIQFAEYSNMVNSDVYMYYFVHRTSANPWPDWTGVMHGYEIDHVFGAPLNSSNNYSNGEEHLSESMLKYWTNFAKSGSLNK